MVGEQQFLAQVRKVRIVTRDGRTDTFTVQGINVRPAEPPNERGIAAYEMMIDDESVGPRLHSMAEQGPEVDAEATFLDEGDGVKEGPIRCKVKVVLHPRFGLDIFPV